MAEARDGGLRVGVIVNPIAGMGGPFSLHGTDGDGAARAAALGATPAAQERMRRALSRLRLRHPGPLTVLAGVGTMGADSALAAGFDVEQVGSARPPTTAEDTRSVARALRDAHVELLLFAGGDGTAADIVGVVGDELVVVGIPSGVKMHSGVFAHTPERAGEIAAAYLADRRATHTEVLDVPAGGLEPSVLAVARVPRSAAGMQGPKATRAGASPLEVRALGRQVAEQMQPGVTYVLGPGTTVGEVLSALDLEGTHNGFDIVVDRALVVADATEQQLVDHLGRHPGGVLVLGVVGGQGFLLGRGNQQVSPRVLRLIDSADIVILAAQDKIAALHPPVLRVDLGTTEPHLALRGYRRVRTSPTRSTVLRVVS